MARSPSVFFSKYHKWFIEMGYPQLDIVHYQDGSWDIIEVVKNPHIPSLTVYKTVLGNMKGIEISYGFCKKYIEEIDLERRAIWDREEAKTKKMEAEQEALEKHRHEYADMAYKAVRYNPDLMDRIATRGLSEMNLDKIAQNIPYSELKSINKSLLAK